MTHRPHAGGKYQKVFDQRKRRIRGLWKRNQAFYAQITVADPQTGEKVVRRTRLEDKDGNPVPTVSEALKGMERLRTKREDDSLRLDPKRTPTLADYSKTYLDRLVGLGDAKRPETIRRERQAMRTFNRHLGELKLRQITAGIINNYMAKRRAPDSAFLFPARHRNERKDMPSVTFNKTLREARGKAGVPDFTCHACRHFFASMCLMSKVDLQTVASWLGHKDNGILLAKTYAHLLQDPKRAQAAQVVFTPVAVAEEKVVS